MQTIFKPFIIFSFCFSILLGSSYNMFLNYDYKSNPDCKTYLSIANGNFENQSLVRRYRIIVPFIAKTISLPIEKVYAKLWPNRDKTDFGALRLGFLIVNLILMSLVGLATFYLAKAYNLSNIISLLITVILLTGGRWASIFTGAPLTDSLYLLIITCTLYSVKTNNHKLLIPILILGVLSKESFLLLIPYIFIFSNFNKLKMIFYTLIGIGLMFLVRYYIDSLTTNTTLYASMEEDANHIYNIKESVLRILNFRGIGELFTVFGIFSFIYFIGFIGGLQNIYSWSKKIDLKIWVLLPIAVIHALLSTEIARMIYLFSAPLLIIMGLIIQNHNFFNLFLFRIQK